MYEHGIIDHKTAKRAASISHPEDEKKEAKPTRKGTRSSKRNQPQKDYAAIHHGKNQRLTPGNTEFSAHVASDTHEKDELEASILCTEENWYKRGVKEAIAIRKLKPTLNQDDGRYHLSSMYTKLIESSDIMLSRQGIKGATVKTQEQN